MNHPARRPLGLSIVGGVLGGKCNPAPGSRVIAVGSAIRIPNVMAFIAGGATYPPMYGGQPALGITRP